MRKESFIVQIENKTIEQQKDIYQLWKEVFGDSDSYLDYYFQWVMPRNQVLGLYNKKELASMIHLNPYEISFLEKVVKVYYIVGVATKESCRKQGMMRELMVASFDYMYEQNVPFTYLCPIDKAIYSPFDFVVFEEYPLWNEFMLQGSKHQSLEHQELKNIKLKSSLIENIVPEHRKRVLKYSEMTQEDFNELYEFSNGFLKKNYNIYIPRNKEYFEELAHQLSVCGGGFIQILTQNGIEGYLAYMMDGVFHIVELLCEKELNSMLLSYGKEEYIRFVKEKEDNTLENKEFIHTFRGSIMGRIICLKEYIKILKRPIEQTFVAYIVDKEIDSNTGIYRITIGPTTSRLEKSDEKIEYSFTIGEFMTFCQKNYTTFIHDVV